MAWNEPGGNNRNPWGGNGKEGPPDLDAILRKLKRKLSSVMRGGGNDKGSFDGGDGNSQKGGSFVFGVIAAIVVGIWFVSGIFIVSPAERAVVLRFGRYIETVEPGPHWIPILIDSRYIVNEQKISTYSYNSQMLTKDENIVDVSLAVQYRVANARNYLFNVVNPTESLRQATASALRQVIGNTTLDQVLTEGREQVRKEVKDQIVDILTIYKAGVQVTDVAMQPAKAPEEVKEAFDDAIKAQEDEERFKNQAQAYAMKVIPIAKGQAKRILAEADAYRQQAVLNAQGNTARFVALLPEYHKAPAIMRERMYLDTIQSVLERSSKVFIDVKGTNNLVYLPLDKIIQQSNKRIKSQKLIDQDISSSFETTNVDNSNNSKHSKESNDQGSPFNKTAMNNSSSLNQYRTTTRMGYNR